MLLSRTFVLSAVLLAAGSASAQTLVNGNFVGDASGCTDLAPFGGFTASAGSDGAPGYFWINSNGGPEVPFVQQSIADLTSGGIHKVTDWYRTATVFNSGGPFQVLIDSSLLYSVNNWRDDGVSFSFEFTATSARALLRFDAEVTADSDWAVDTIPVREGPAPTALGMMSIAGLRGRR